MIKDRVSDREAREAFHLYVKATGKTMADTLNRAGGNAAFTAMKHVPAAKVSSMTEWNPKGRKGTAKQKQYHHAIATKTGHPKGSGNAAAAVAGFNRRKSSRGFMAALFIEIARDFGEKRKLRTAGMGRESSKSKATKATPATRRAFLDTGFIDDRRGGVDKLAAAWDKGLAHAIYGPSNLVEYALKQLAKQDAKHGSRKR